MKLSERDFGFSDSDIPLVDDISKQYRDEIIDYEDYSLVAFRFPCYSDINVEELLKDFIDKVEKENYGLSKFGREASIGRLQPIPGEDLDVFFITFEAKYNNFQFKFAESLYHLTSVDALHDIDQQDLVAMSSNPIFTYDKRVYLFNNIPVKDIFDFAVEKVEYTRSEQFALLKIDTEKLMQWKDFKDGVARFYVDTKVSNLEMSEARAIYTYENVPREFLEEEVVIFKLNQWFRPISKSSAKLSDF